MVTANVQICAVLAAADPSGLYVLSLTGRHGGALSLPVAPFDPARGQSFEARLREWTSIHTAAQITHVEQVGAKLVDGRIQICLLALVSDRNAFMPRGAKWISMQEIFPWECWQCGEPDGLGQVFRPALREWVGAAAQKERAARKRRMGHCFGADVKTWVPARADKRFALLYEAALVPESLRDHTGATVSVRQRHAHIYGHIMQAKDRQVLADTLAQLRRRISHENLLAALVPAPFTLGVLQKSVEAIYGLPLHTQNFRRDIVHSGYIVKTGESGRVTMNGYTSRPGALWRWTDRAPDSGGVPLPLRAILP